MDGLVIVASSNPVKITASQRAFETVFPDGKFTFESVNVESGVSDQPMSDKETLQGAINRSSNARIVRPNADYWVGLEGGVVDMGSDMEASAWMVVQSQSMVGKARTASFSVPPKVANLIRGGMELGHADDKVYGIKNSKQANGSIGLLTDDLITRTDYYEHALILALIPFKHPELYGEDH